MLQPPPPSHARIVATRAGSPSARPAGSRAAGIPCGPGGSRRSGPARRLPGHRPVRVERGLQHALAPARRRQRPLQLVQPGRGHLPRQHVAAARPPPTRRRQRHRPVRGQHRRHRPDRVGRISSRNRAIGSCTRVPAARSAAISTSGVSPRKSAAGAGHALVELLVGVALPRRVAGVRHRDHAVDHLPAVQALAEGCAGRSPRPSGRTRTASSPARPPAGTRPAAHRRPAPPAARPWPGTGCPRPSARTPRPVPVGRSTQIVVVSRNVTARPYSSARVAWTTSFCTSPYRETRDLLADVVLAQVDQRVLLGQLAERGLQRPALARSVRDHDGLQRRRGEVLGRPGRAGRRPGRRSGCPAVPTACRSVPRGRTRGRTTPPRSNTPMPVTFCSPASRSRTRRVPSNSRAYAIFSPAGPRSTLNTVPETGPSGSPAAGGSSVAIAVGQLGHPGAGDGRAEEHRVHQRPARVCSARPARNRPQGTDPSRTYAASSESSDVDSWLSSRLGELRVRRRCRRTGCRASRTAVIGTIAGVSFAATASTHPVRVGAGAVDLVDEQQRGQPQPAQRAHQHPGLRLHALHRREHQHRAVEHAEHPLHLGDEVRVAGGVDEVDRHAADRERDHGGLDRDPALPLQRERVGLGAAGVDAADLVDHTGVVQQPLGEAGLTGVDVRQDAEIEQGHGASCPRGRSSGWT